MALTCVAAVGDGLLAWKWSAPLEVTLSGTGRVAGRVEGGRVACDYEVRARARGGGWGAEARWKSGDALQPTHQDALRSVLRQLLWRIEGPEVRGAWQEAGAVRLSDMDEYGNLREL